MSDKAKALAIRGRGGTSNRGRGRANPALPPPLKPEEMVNRYQILGSIPKPYSSVLATQAKDPYEICEPSPQPIRSIKPNSYPKGPRAEYVPKPNPVNLFYVEFHFLHRDDPILLAEQFYPKNWHFTPLNPNKSINYYKEILFSTGSIHIKPIYDTKTGTELLYHSLFIQNITPMAAWGHPSLLRKLPNDEPFSYYDYMDAWFYVLLHQNEKQSHSWFLNFDKDFKSNIPAWFLKWWDRHGPLVDIFPTELQEQLTLFKPIAYSKPLDQHIPLLLLFVSKFKIPWILKWQYNLPPLASTTIQTVGTSTAVIEHREAYNIVTRQYFVKWWDKFMPERIIDAVKKELEKFNSIKPPSGPPLTNLQVPPSISELRGDASSSAKPSKKKPSSSKGLDKFSKKELKKMVLDLISKSDEDSDEEFVPQSSEESITGRYHDQSDIYQDAQDPFA